MLSRLHNSHTLAQECSEHAVKHIHGYPGIGQAGVEAHVSSKAGQYGWEKVMGGWNGNRERALLAGERAYQVWV